LDKLASVATAFLQAQIAAGTQVVQLFDSWVGCLSPDDYRRYVLPYTKQVIDGLRHAGAPVIHFGTDTAMLLDVMREAGSDVMGVDWRIPLDDAWRRIGPDVGIQGNLDPVALFAPLHELRTKVQELLKRTGSRPGHIFNLGHGILPDTALANVERMLKRVRGKK
jgi:uroporphyrinogen decarboxylase